MRSPAKDSHAHLKEYVNVHIDHMHMQLSPVGATDCQNMPASKLDKPNTYTYWKKLSLLVTVK